MGTPKFVARLYMCGSTWEGDQSLFKGFAGQ